MDEKFRQCRGFGTRITLEKLAHNSVELAAINQATAAKVPYKPLTCAEVAGHHGKINPQIAAESRLPVTAFSTAIKSGEAREKRLSVPAVFFGPPKIRTAFERVKLGLTRFHTQPNPLSCAE